MYKIASADFDDFSSRPNIRTFATKSIRRSKSFTKGTVSRENFLTFLLLTMVFKSVDVVIHLMCVKWINSDRNFRDVINLLHLNIFAFRTRFYTASPGGGWGSGL